MAGQLEAITIFAAVAELASFAAAARRLNRTPAAVTRAVAALEDQLRTRLFNRTTRSVALTGEGARYLEACRRLLAAYDDVRQFEPGSSAQPHGQLSVTAPDMFGRLHVMPSIATFLELYPQVDIRTLLLDRVVSLIDEGLDVGVRLGELPDSSLRAISAGHVVKGVYASPAYLARHGTPQSPLELGGHRVVSCLGVTPVPGRWTFESMTAGGTVAVTPRLVVNGTEAAAIAAASGVGLTYLVSYQADNLVRAGQLQRVLAAYSPPPIPVHIIHPAGRFLTAKVRLFIAHIVADLRRNFGRDPAGS